MIWRISGDPEAAVISLFHSTTDNDFEMRVSDLTDPSYTDTNFDLFQLGDTAGRYFEVDVTDWVLTDYMQEGDDPVVSFRLETSERSHISMARIST